MIYAILIMLMIATDQLIKYLVVNKLMPLRSIPIIEDVFHLTYAENTGAAFSIFRDKQLFLIVITLLVICFMAGVLAKYVKTGMPLLMNVSLALIIGGAIGNLIDRMRINYVIDYFDFRLINFAIFNMADVFIVCGTMLLGVLVLFNKVEI
jgi:signal peptidase II